MTHKQTAINGKRRREKQKHTQRQEIKGTKRKREEKKQRNKQKNEERANISGESKPGYDAILDAPGYIQPGGYSHVMGLIRQSLTERPNGGGVS